MSTNLFYIFLVIMSIKPNYKLILDLETMTNQVILYVSAHNVSARSGLIKPSYLATDENAVTLSNISNI